MVAHPSIHPSHATLFFFVTDWLTSSTITWINQLSFIPVVIVVVVVVVVVVVIVVVVFLSIIIFTPLHILLYNVIVVVVVVVFFLLDMRQEREEEEEEEENAKINQLISNVFNIIMMMMRVCVCV